MIANNQRQFGALVQQILSGEAEPAELRKFEAQLLDSEDLVDWLGEQFELAALLQWQHAPPAWKLPQGNNDAGEDDRIGTVSLAFTPASRISRFWRRLVEFANQPGTLATIVAALATACIVLVLALITAPVSVRQHHTPAAPLVANITSTIQCTWAAEVPENALAQGEQVDLLSGVVEIRFDDGARVLLQGPATFELTSANSGYLRRGKLVAHVPKRAVGFVITTPLARVVDLGTEFAVSVSEEQSCEVHVYEGRTEVELLSHSASVREAVPLAAGEAMRIAKAGSGVHVELSKANHSEFVRQLSDAIAERPLAIGVDFQRGEEPNHGVAIEPQQLAGLVPQVHWNIGQIGTRPLGTEEFPVVDSRGSFVEGMRIDWNSGTRGAVAKVDTSLAGRILGDYITSNRDPTNPDQPLKVTVTGLPEEYRRGGYSLICYRHAANHVHFDAPNTIQIDYHADGTIDDEATLPSTASRTFRLSGRPKHDFKGFHARFEIPEAVEQFDIIVDAPQGKLATLSGLQIVPSNTPSLHEEQGQ